MSFKRALPLALTVALALPAAAGAQEQITPPKGDDYLNPVFLNEGAPLAKGDVLGFTVDTSSYTTQRDLGDPQYDPNTGARQPNPESNDFPEPTSCGTSRYGKTVWSVFHANRYGTIDISASSGTFDEVITVIPFGDPDTDATPLLSARACFDDIRGFQQDASGIIYPGQWYAVQVGGTINSTSNAEGGPMQVKVSLFAPPRLEGDAVLSWRSNGGVARVKSLKVNAEKGARIKVTCSHHGCGKNPRTLTSRKTVAAGVFSKLPVRAAKRKFTLLAGRRLKNGTTITIRIYEDGYIGKHFSYKVKNGVVSSKTVRCTQPGSSKPRRKCG